MNFQALAKLLIFAAILSSTPNSHAVKKCVDVIEKKSLSEVIAGIEKKLKISHWRPLVRHGNRIGYFFPREIAVVNKEDGRLFLNIGLGQMTIDLKTLIAFDSSQLNLKDPVSSVFVQLTSKEKLLATRESLKPGEEGEVALVVWKFNKTGDSTSILLQIVEQKSDGSIDFKKTPLDVAEYGTFL